MDIEELKVKKDITRDDIEELLKSIGETGVKRQEKIDTVKQLNQVGGNGIRLEQTLESYRNF